MNFHSMQIDNVPYLFTLIESKNGKQTHIKVENDHVSYTIDGTLEEAIEHVRRVRNLVK